MTESEAGARSCELGLFVRAEGVCVNAEESDTKKFGIVTLGEDLELFVAGSFAVASIAAEL